MNIYLVVGVPGSGKTWVCNQLEGAFHLIRHDQFIFVNQPGAYLKEVLKQAPIAIRPLLIEAPFSVSEIKDPLERAGHKVIPIFIIEDDKTLGDRYLKRENRIIPQGHLTRTKTYLNRAKELGAFFGTSNEVLNYLKGVAEIHQFVGGVQ